MDSVWQEACCLLTQWVIAIMVAMQLGLLPRSLQRDLYKTHCVLGPRVQAVNAVVRDELEPDLGSRRDLNTCQMPVYVPGSKSEIGFHLLGAQMIDNKGL